MISEATKQRILEMRRVMDAMGVTAATAGAETSNTLTDIWRRLGRQHSAREKTSPAVETAEDNIPQKWADLPEGHAFSVGDLFTYYSKTYRVLRVFTKQSGWAPPAQLDDYYALA